MRMRSRLLSACCLSLLLVGQASATEDTNQSFNAGLLHPSGDNLLGYAVETPFNDTLYWFYAFGFPTLAAIGITHDVDRDGNGLTSTVGTSLGSIAYASVAYQVSIGNRSFV